MSIEDLIEEFSELDDRERGELLIDLSRDLPRAGSEIMVDRNLVPGCQSRVWLVADVSQDDPPAIDLVADSDSEIVRGLISILLTMYSGRSAAGILNIDSTAIFDDLGLKRYISPTRRNGLHSMVSRIREIASGAVGETRIDVVEQTEAQSATAATDEQPTRDVPAAKADFPILNKPLPSGGQVVYLDSASSAQKPAIVIEKEREVLENYYANAFRGRYYFGSRVDDEIEATRERVRSLIGAESTDEIVFTSGTTMSINLVASAWGRRYLGPGDELLLNEMEHHANLVPWQKLAAERRATLRFLPLTHDGQLDLSGLDEVLTSRTRLVAVTGMSNVLGTINPIDELARRAHEVGALILVDGAQSVPHQRVNVSAGRIDFLAFSGHKLFGPGGTGVLYGRRDHLESMDPFLCGGHMIEHVSREHSTFAAPPAKFEAGTLPIVQIIGLRAAIDYVQSFGFDAIGRHEQRLLEYAHRQLATVPGLRIYGPAPENKGAIVSFSIDGVSAEDLAFHLDQRGVFTRHGHHCTMPLHDFLGVPSTTRASFALYNTLDDVDALVAAICDATSG